MNERDIAEFMFFLMELSNCNEKDGKELIDKWNEKNKILNLVKN